MSIFKKLTIPIINYFLALAPLKSQAQSLYFHIGDMLNKQNYTEIGASLEGINITLEDLENNRVIAELTTDENGNARYNFTRVIDPNFNINFNGIRSTRVYDISGRLEEILYGNNLRESPGKPSGIRIYSIEDIYGNKKAVKSLNLEGEIRNGIITLNVQEIQKYGKKGIASIDELRNIKLSISDPDTAYFQFIDTLNVDDAQNQELNLDLFPNVELQWPEDQENRPYRNFLHFIKNILYSTDEDVEYIAERTGRRWQHVRWPRFPVNYFPNDRDAPNDNYRNSIRDFEEDVNDISYGNYSHDFVDLVDAIPDSGSRYDFSQEGSWWNTHQVWNVISGDSLIVVVNGEIYINNNVNGIGIRSAVYHESLNQLVIGRDSGNHLDIQNAAGPYPIELSNNDKMLLIVIKNMPPNYRKLLNHREY